MEHMNVRVNFNMADYSDLHFSAKEEALLRALGAQVAEVAARPVMQERKQLWTAHNKLQRTRPVLLCDPENGWNEIIPDSTIACENSIARHWELHLRKQLYWGEHIADDYVVEPVFPLPHVHTTKAWGVAGRESTFTKNIKTEEGGAYHIDAIMEDYAQLDTLEPETYQVDYAKTDALLDIARRLFDGNLSVQLNTVWFWSFGLTDEAAFLRGMEELMYDFYDEPEQVHRMMDILLRGVMQKLDFLEKNGLFSLNNDATYVGSGGLGFTDELPAPGFAGRVRTRDMWGLAESQITVGVSPEMFEEFIFPYQKQLMERFGLTCYGCCEPMDARFDIVKQVQNLRRVSVSPWADKQVMADKLGHSYIYSLKPTPADLAMPQLDTERVRAELREQLHTARDNCLEIIMKDNHTLGGNPANLTDWANMAREEIERL